MPRIRLLWAISILLGAVLLLACSTISTASSVGVTPTPVQHAKVGQLVQLPGWAITLEKITTTQGVGYDPKPPGDDTYLLITLTMKNVSSSQQLANSADYALRDLQGNDEATALLFSAKNFSDTLLPGAQVHGTLNFTVPERVHAFTLTYTPAANYPLTTLAEWDISD